MTDLKLCRLKQVKKAHLCAWCDEEIPKKHPAIYRVSIFQSNFSAEYFHTVCYDALLDWEDVDDEGFEPGTFVKGTIIRKDEILNLHKDSARSALYDEIEAEYYRALEKHPDFPFNIFEQATIIFEEAGEVAQAVLQYTHEGGTIDHIRKELIQTATMCIRMLEDLTNKEK